MSELPRVATLSNPHDAFVDGLSSVLNAGSLLDILRRCCEFASSTDAEDNAHEEHEKQTRAAATLVNLWRPKQPPLNGLLEAGLIEFTSLNGKLKKVGFKKKSKDVWGIWVFPTTSVEDRDKYRSGVLDVEQAKLLLSNKIHCATWIGLLTLLSTAVFEQGREKVFKDPDDRARIKQFLTLWQTDGPFGSATNTKPTFKAALNIFYDAWIGIIRFDPHRYSSESTQKYAYMMKQDTYKRSLFIVSNDDMSIPKANDNKPIRIISGSPPLEDVDEMLVFILNLLKSGKYNKLVYISDDDSSALNRTTFDGVPEDRRKYIGKGLKYAVEQANRVKRFSPLQS